MEPRAESFVLRGRDEELARLRAGLERALAGRGRLALISGEPGIGKSTLAAALADEACSRGASVTWGQAWEFADAPPYFPVWPCLRALGINPAADDAREHDESRAFHLWERVVAALAHATSSAPCVWIVEDAHAADLASLDLLTYLTQPLHAMRMLVVVTARSHDPRVTDRMSQRLGRMAREGLDIQLGPLGEADTRALAEAGLGPAAATARALDRIVHLTGGNPLFIVECSKSFLAMHAEDAKAALPATVRQVVLERVQLLPESARASLACGAVLGREFSAALVARMSGTLPARVIDTLLPALRAGNVREIAPGKFSFSHALVRDAIYEHLPHEERVRLHTQAARALAALEETADTLVERARHALAGLQPGGELAALEIVDRASDWLEREGALDRAHELHMRAGEARATGALPPLPPLRKLHVARIAHASGRSEVSRQLCEQVLAAARAEGDGELFANAALQHGADVRPGIRDGAQIALLEEAIDMLGDTLPQLSCRVLARLATAHQPADDQSIPEGICREAIRRARATGDEEALIYTLQHGSWAFCYAPVEERAAPAEELLERAVRIGDRPAALFAHGWLAWCDGERGDFSDFDRRVTSMLSLSDEVGHPRHRWRALLYASGRAITAGQFAESDRCVTEVAMLSSLIDDFAMTLSLGMHQALRRLTQRRDDELARHVDDLSALLGNVAAGDFMASAYRSAAFARTENLEATRAELAKIQPLGWVRGSTWHVSSHSVAFVAEACALAGTDEERRALREVLRAMPWVDLSADLIGHIYAGSRARLLGLLEASLGDLVEAERHLREAQERAAERRHTPWIAQIAYERAKVSRAARREREASELMAACLRIARDLGMTGLERAASTSDCATEIDLAPPPEKLETPAMERRGDVWLVTAGTRRALLKDSRGARLLAKLIDRPNEELHVLALASDEGASVAESNAGELLDESARKAYEARVVGIDRELAKSDPGAGAKHIAKLERERAALRAELARAVGLAGRVRVAGSATERARVSVQKRLREAIARIREGDEALGEFLERNVSTGTFCTFRM